MIHKINDLSQAFEKAQQMPWAYIACHSFLFLGATPKKIHWNQIQDARFFGPEGELRLFLQGKNLRAVWIDDTPQEKTLDTVIDKTVPLRSRYGKELCMRQHIVFDKDGQAYIYTIRLKELIGGKHYGTGVSTDSGSPSRTL